MADENIDWKLYSKNDCAIHNLVNLDVLLINENKIDTTQRLLYH